MLNADYQREKKRRLYLLYSLGVHLLVRKRGTAGHGHSWHRTQIAHISKDPDVLSTEEIQRCARRVNGSHNHGEKRRRLTTWEHTSAHCPCSGTTERRNDGTTERRNDTYLGRIQLYFCPPSSVGEQDKSFPNFFSTNGPRPEELAPILLLIDLLAP